jgi:uncharacterized protein
MKKVMMLTAFLLGCIILSHAQARDYKVVFDITSKDSMDHKSVIRWLSEISNANPNAQLEVVFYGQSLDMVTTNKSVVAAQVLKFAANKNITFKVCAIALKNHNMDKSELLAGVETVPDGIYEIISREKSGWGYIKASH